MVRTQVILEEEQLRALKALAAQRGVSMSELVRESVNRLLEQDKRKLLWDRALEVMGKYDSGKTDISVNHDEYLDEIYGSW